ncbi:MAG: hypothetical protein UU14_C0047G0006 [Candidatus Roizmanbacteria bacterium GW2011_GWB1_40_7]|uniref:Uncharacterized protein n=1 Tax=Candidatus Roizmanbacteria bacterium GW2011_GWB1_40_7 TaxID=1618482 RepID=A0A0G0T6Z7_9BACT|nr:MAG: hypothetical protein UU14_C0047G0006 [Candidatus Roizmanbacteria bacterium GW2011_GWB1_40_7]
MKQVLLLFAGGIILALLVVGGYLVARTYFASADEDLIPQNIEIDRSSPTAAVIKFTTNQPVLASVECSQYPDGPFALCGAESQETDNHEVKTSIILDPEVEYHFFIKIRNITYDNLGSPFVIPVKSAPAVEFPDSVLGTCSGDSGYNVKFDINKDGCIRANDKVLYLTQ